MHHFDPIELQRYSRQFPVIGVEGQQRLKEAKVLCVGGGGLGCPALQYLAACGIGTLGVMDEDRVDLSNLQRQILFTEKDIGRNKAQVIAERLTALNSTIDIKAHPHFLSAANAESILLEYDLVLDASDNYPTRYLLNDFCRTLKKPLVSASIFQFEGQLSVFNYKDGPCYQCLYPEPPPAHLAPNCSLSGVLGVLPGVAGCLQAMEAIKVILGYDGVLSGTLLSINLLTMQFKHFELQKKECSKHQKINATLTNKACSGGETVINELTALELKQKLQEHPEALLLLDVREQFEREICHIGGIHMPLSSFSLEQAMQILPTSSPIIVYCKSGIRSAKVCLELGAVGFTKVYNLQGGIMSWIEVVDNSLALY